MSMQKRKQPKEYKDGRTKQAFRDETDINKILQRAQKTGTISHLNKHEAVYGDFANYDFLYNNIQMTRGRQIFDELPSELRSEFDNSPADFFKYVNNPENKDRLGELLPALAEPGRQNIATAPANADTEAASDAASEPLASKNITNTAEAGPTAEKAPEAPIVPST